MIFLLTDGLDQVHAAAWSTGSDPYLRDLVRRAVRSQVTIITILPGPTGRPFLAAQDMAIQTGGWWLYPSDDLPGLLERLGQRLLESYYISYDTSRPAGDTRRLSVDVAVDRRDFGRLEVRTVAGVFGETPLIDLLADEIVEDDAGKRARAIGLLGAVNDPEAVSLLSRALEDDDPNVRASAAVALGRRASPDGARHLIRLLKDPDAEVRRAAVDALSRLLASNPDERTQARILDALESEQAPP